MSRSGRRWIEGLSVGIGGLLILRILALLDGPRLAPGGRSGGGFYTRAHGSTHLAT